MGKAWAGHRKTGWLRPARVSIACHRRCILSPAFDEAGVEPSPVSLEEAILAYVETHGRITRREAVALTGLGEEQARYLLRKLTEQGALQLVGARRGAHYRIPRAGKNGE